MHKYYTDSELTRDKLLKSGHNFYTNGLYTNHRIQKVVIDALSNTDLADISISRRYLDLGCGQGSWLNFFYSLFKGNISVEGIDISPAQVSNLKQVYPIFNAQVMSMDKLGFEDASFDLVSAFTSLMFIKSYDELESSIGEVSRVLKNGGYFLIVDAYKKKGHFSGDELDKKGFSGFNIVELDKIATKHGFEIVYKKPIFKQLFYIKRSRFNTVNLSRYIGYMPTLFLEIFAPGRANNFISLYRKVK